MSAPSKPDPARSYALIIGTSEYDDPMYPQVNSIADTADAFRSLISTDRMWNLPPRNVDVLTGRVTMRQAAEAVDQVAVRPGVDGLFVYLCTHGKCWTENHVADHGLHLAFSDSVWDWPFTHLPFEWVAHRIRRDPVSASTLLIIDACYSAGAFLAGAPSMRPPAMPGPNVSTMIATKYRQPADTSWPGTAYTAFSGSLIDTIDNGVEDAGEYLTAETIFPAARKKLQAGGHPEPDYRVRGSVIVCRNSAYQRITSEIPFDDLISGLTTADPVSPAVYAAAIEDSCREDDQSVLTRRLVTEFGQKCPAATVVKLAELLRSRGLPVLGEHAALLIESYYAVRDGSDIAELLHHMHNPDGDDTDADDVLEKLTSRPPQITADLNASLRGARCPSCQAISRRIDARVLDLWQGPRRIELLATLH